VLDNINVEGWYMKVNETKLNSNICQRKTHFNRTFVNKAIGSIKWGIDKIKLYNLNEILNNQRNIITYIILSIIFSVYNVLNKLIVNVFHIRLFKSGYRLGIAKIIEK
jgi:ABC-type glycerol-3-phosphate transport system permease component